MTDAIKNREYARKHRETQLINNKEIFLENQKFRKQKFLQNRRLNKRSEYEAELKKTDINIDTKLYLQLIKNISKIDEYSAKYIKIYGIVTK
jgi:hypothetical protein